MYRRSYGSWEHTLYRTLTYIKLKPNAKLHFYPTDLEPSVTRRFSQNWSPFTVRLKRTATITGSFFVLSIHLRGKLHSEKI